MNQALINIQTQWDPAPQAGSQGTAHGALNPAQSDLARVFSHQVTTPDELTASFELIKILQQFTHTNRWTLLIAPEHIPDKTLLDCCSIDMERVLVVHEKQISNTLATIENALSHATCSAVIAWCGNIKQNKLAAINQLAEQSQCHFYAFNKHNKSA